MFPQRIKNGLILIGCLVFIIAGCRKKDAPLPDNAVQFEATEMGMGDTTSAVTIKLRLSRAADRDIPITVSLSPTGVEYGTDFTTQPATIDGKMALTILSGSSETSFTLSKSPGVTLYGEENILFKIESSGSPVIIGTMNELTLNFAEIISQGAAMIGDGGGSTYGNKVFFDLSANTQSAVQRTKWDLGFYSGDEWRVILNSSSAMMAKQIDKNDLNAVTASDTIGFSSTLIFNQYEPDPATLPYVDYPDGDLNKTAIDEVASNADDNKVYIINMGKGIGNPAPERGWKKVRVIRNAAGGYTLQYADINETTFQTIDIPKNDAFYFNYVSFATGLLEVEPAKEKWDIAWTYFTNVTDFGGGEVPYTFQDVILQNRNVQTAKVLTTTKSYTDFSEADIATLTFSSIQTGIGSDWRLGGGPGSSPAVKTDRFYVIKDGDENYYKIKFTAMTKDGERGYPAFEYVLLKKGN